MSEKDEKELWEKNIKPTNKFLWITQLKWKFYLAGQWVRRRKIIGVNDVNWSMDDIYKLVYVLLILMIISMALSIIKEAVYLVYPNYGNNTMIIRDFLDGIGG